jgi:hypothetical protein
MRRALLLGLLLLAAGLTGAETLLRTPGQAYFGRNRYVEYIAGSLPIVLSAPHGGRERPEELPDRAEGTFAFDVNTQELARAIDEAFVARTGQHPHVVLCRVSRRKVDCNREIAEGAAGHALTEQTWRDFQGFITEARAAVVARHGQGFYIDLHGHGHPDARLELGYSHGRADLALKDEDLGRPALAAKGSLNLFAVKDPAAYPALLHGPRSLGGLLEKAGFPATPSPGKPVPEDPFFNGGYNTRTHTAAGTRFAGLQIETNSKGVRDTEANRRRFATALTEQLAVYLDERLSLKLPTAPPAK